MGGALVFAWVSRYLINIGSWHLLKCQGLFPKNNFNIRWLLQLKNKYENIKCSDGHKT